MTRHRKRSERERYQAKYRQAVGAMHHAIDQKIAALALRREAIAAAVELREKIRLLTKENIRAEYQARHQSWNQLFVLQLTATEDFLYRGGMVAVDMMLEEFRHEMVKFFKDKAVKRDQSIRGEAMCEDARQAQRWNCLARSFQAEEIIAVSMIDTRDMQL